MKGGKNTLAVFDFWQNAPVVTSRLTWLQRTSYGFLFSDEAG